MNSQDRLKAAAAIVVAAAALGLLSWQISSNSAPPGGGGIDTNDPKVKEQLRKHYEGMAAGRTGPSSGPPGSLGEQQQPPKLGN
jgi:hypothetical protein